MTFHRVTKQEEKMMISLFFYLFPVMANLQFYRNPIDASPVSIRVSLLLPVLSSLPSCLSVNRCVCLSVCLRCLPVCVSTFSSLYKTPSYFLLSYHHLSRYPGVFFKWETKTTYSIFPILHYKIIAVFVKYPG